MVSEISPSQKDPTQSSTSLTVDHAARDLIVPRDEIISNQEEILKRAIDRWVEFYKRMWSDSNVVLERTGRQYNLWGNFLRITVILFSVCVTTVSGLEVDRSIITILAGILTLFTSVEGFFLLLDRQSEVKQMQREMQALRDELAYEWMITVELETEIDQRIAAAKKMLKEGPAAYNELLNKYAFKSEEGGGSSS